MARRERLANNAETTLASAVLPADGTISVSNASAFPTEGDFRIVVNNELMLVTAVSGTTFTVTRGIEGTNTSNHAAGDPLANVITEEGFKQLIREAVDPFAFDHVPFRIQNASGTLLTSSDFTAVTTTNATVTDNADGSISIRFLAPSATERFPRLVRTAPATPYTISGAIKMTAITDDAASADGPIFGPFFRDSVNNEQIMWRWRPLDTQTSRFRANHYTAEAFTAGLDSLMRIDGSPGTVQFFEMSDDGTDIFFRYSADGVHFIEWFTQARGLTLTGTPDQIGFGIINADISIDEAIGTLLAWQE